MRTDLVVRTVCRFAVRAANSRPYREIRTSFCIVGVGFPDPCRHHIKMDELTLCVMI